jgi:Predicted ATPase of the ABC class
MASQLSYKLCHWEYIIISPAMEESLLSRINPQWVSGAKMDGVSLAWISVRSSQIFLVAQGRISGALKMPLDQLAWLRMSWRYPPSNRQIVYLKAIELGSHLLLFDEDLCATNFMIRDDVMRKLVKQEPITPLIERVSPIQSQSNLDPAVIPNPQNFIHSRCRRMFRLSHRRPGPYDGKL